MLNFGMPLKNPFEEPVHTLLGLGHDLVGELLALVCEEYRELLALGSGPVVVCQTLLLEDLHNTVCVGRIDVKETGELDQRETLPEVDGDQICCMDPRESIIPDTVRHDPPGNQAEPVEEDRQERVPVRILGVLCPTEDCPGRHVLYSILLYGFLMALRYYRILHHGHSLRTGFNMMFELKKLTELDELLSQMYAIFCKELEPTVQPLNVRCTQKCQHNRICKTDD